MPAECPQCYKRLPPFVCFTYYTVSRTLIQADFCAFFVVLMSPLKPKFGLEPRKVFFVVVTSVPIVCTPNQTILLSAPLLSLLLSFLPTKPSLLGLEVRSYPD
jgi:hypothetical protein